MADNIHFQNGNNHQMLLKWFTLIPELKDLCEIYCNKDLDNWMPEGAKVFWNEVYDSFERALYNCMYDLKEEILEVVKDTQDETRSILKQVGLKPEDQLWSFGDLVKYFKLPEHIVSKIIEQPTFPRTLSIRVDGDKGNEIHHRWFAKDVVSYTSQLQFPPPMSASSRPCCKSKRNNEDATAHWSDEKN